jgi:glycosyltransferase involved in cell wall biosynthesis
MTVDSKATGKVCIVLPTYNGAKYLANQLDSILSQTYDNIEVYLRDDGSSDTTKDVIRKYAVTYANVHYIEDDLGNLNCPASFYEIIRRVEPCDYYAFADQDDIWEAGKVQRAVDALSSLEDGTPGVYYSSFTYVDANGAFIRVAPQQDSETPFVRTLFYTPGLGFTIAFNRQACEDFILKVEPGPEMHDRWMLRCGSVFGRVIYDSVPTAKHVRHESAVTAGDNRYIDLLGYFIKEELFGTKSREESNRLAHFYHVFGDKLAADQKETMELFVNSGGFAARLKKVFYPQALRPTKAGDLMLRVLFLFGRA